MSPAPRPTLPPPPPKPPAGPDPGGSPSGPRERNLARTAIRLVAFSTPLLTVPAYPGFSWVETPNAVIFGVALAVLSFSLLRPQRYPHVLHRVGNQPGGAR